MTRRYPFALLCLIAGALLAAPSAVAEAEAQGQSAAEGWTVPRTADGRPDLQGVWDFRSITPLERPEEFAGRDRLTEEDEAALVERALDRQIDRAPPPGEVGGYNQFWMDRGIKVNENRRTSLIVDPPDGRLPPLAEGAVHQQGSLLEDIPGELPVRYRAGGLNADGPEHRGIAERCLLGFNVGPPMRPGGYNNNMQLFQTADQVTILHEMVHDFRVIPLDERPHLPDHMPQWLGSSRGRWEGDTLVVETTNFTDKTPAYDPNGTTGLGIGANMHLVERFTRTADDILLYEYTLTEPETFTRPFTVAINMRRGAAPIFEYACHEGNYGMFDILAGGRHQEREAQAAGGSR